MESHDPANMCRRGRVESGCLFDAVAVGAYGFVIASIAASDNGTRNRERAGKSLTAKSLSSRSPVHAMVTRSHRGLLRRQQVPRNLGCVEVGGFADRRRYESQPLSEEA